ncbi:MAG: urease accessory protein UreE [Gammaproteobacteria bacterium]|nr:urease accessory protein UreE [Gammaproteobacteria bacterium]
MLKISKKLTRPQAENALLKLPFEQRQKSRLKVTLDDGRPAGLFLERGEVLRGGDCLQAEDDSVIRIEAADETLSLVQSDDPLLLARACYHLGNRHIALQIETQSLSYLHDHVLDDMLKNLGLSVKVIQAPFEPESGAYAAAHGHHHDNQHNHAHG